MERSVLMHWIWIGLVEGVVDLSVTDDFGNQVPIADWSVINTVFKA